MFTRLFTTACVLVSLQISAQDLHFSQFYNQPMALNPASTGIFQGDFRGAASYRSQWASVPVNYQTFAGAFDWKPFQLGSNKIALGFLLQHDVAGDGGLSWTQLGASGSVIHALSSTQGLAAGFGIGVAQRYVNLDKLTFQNQWGGDLFDPGLSSKEQLNQNSRIRSTLSAGLQWFYQSTTSRTFIKAGIGALHLNQPNISFSSDHNFQLPIRVTFHADCALQVREWLDLVVFGLSQQMQKSRELVLGAGLRSVLSNGPGSQMAARFSLAHRLGDAWIPAVQLERNNWIFGLSYDWNNSPFQVATAGRGGFELSAIYQLLPAPALKSFKSCPIF